MHLGNSVICPVTGIPMLALAGITAFYAFKHARKNFSKDKIIPTVLLTVFVFALQTVNFAIPTTGSSGHIVGAVLLAILSGPCVAFLSMSAVLLVQAVFFADGGLVSLGCNIFNMGFLACFVAYPFIYKPLADKNHKFIGAVLASVVALQLGSTAVVTESALSGSTSLNIGLFMGLMQSIHLVIGVVEGLFTALIISFADSKVFNYTIGGASLFLAGVISNYASTKPDGLEWSLLKISDNFVAQTSGQFYATAENLQSQFAMLNTMPSVTANITGLVILSVSMFIICKTLAFKKTV